MLLAMEVSFTTPPFGLLLFVMQGVAPPGIDVITIYKGVVPFIVLQLIGMFIIFNWDAIVTWLPAQAYG